MTTDAKRRNKKAITIRYSANHQGKRIVAVVLALLLIFFISTASVYSIAHIHHDCTGDNCPICHHIQALWALLADLAKAIVLGFFLYTVCNFLKTFVGIRPSRDVFRLSPVRLFDRMND